MIRNSVVGRPSISLNNIKPRTKLTGQCLHKLNLKFILKKKIKTQLAYSINFVDNLSLFYCTVVQYTTH